MRKLESNRTGITYRQSTGYDAFIPHKLCETDLNINIDMELLNILSEADRSLGELNGITKLLSNPDLFIGFYVKKEALLSSQIEGTQCSLDDVIKVDINKNEVKPVIEVINYIQAMNYGLKELENIPMSLRLMNKIHKELLKDVRGREKKPGEFKRYQNWIGAPGCTLNEAVFVPPPPNMMIELMGDLENYYHSCSDLPPLIKSSILHAYFETIHPFTDGNGRLGRLLITFMLCEKKILDKPLLYLSLFFKEHKSTYYNLLMDVRFKGAWEEWIKFFLRGVRNTSNEAIATAKDIIFLQEFHKNLINDKLIKYSNSFKLYELLCNEPIISITDAVEKLDSTYPTVKALFDKFVELDILAPYDIKSRNKLYYYAKYLEILRRGT